MNAEKPFLKVGDVLINPSQIVTVNLDFEDDGTRGVSISLANGEFHLFVGDEARVLRCYFLLGSLAVDLNNLHGQTKNGGQQC